jgi:hypothetical protein
MRRLAVPALALWVLAASPAFAQITGEDMGYEQQTEGYGKIFGYVCGAGATLGVLIGGYYIFKSMMAENERGKKTGIGLLQERILDDKDAPKKKRILYLGEKVPDWKVNNRIAATHAACMFLAKADDWFEPKYIIKITAGVFKAVKAAVEGRSIEKVAEKLGDECLEELRAEIAKLKKKKEKRVFGKPEVMEAQVVHVEAPANQKKHTVTVLVAARSKDYIVDAPSGEVKRGDKKTYVYFEFWRFVRTKERWLVDRIRPAGDMDRVLDPKNLLTPADMAKFEKKADENQLREFVKG